MKIFDSKSTLSLFSRYNKNVLILKIFIKIYMSFRRKNNFTETIYNQFKVGVDVVDSITSDYEIRRKTLSWK